MLENILYLSSELTLVLGMLFLLFERVFKEGSYRSYFKVTRIFVALSMCFAVLFYNKTISEAFLSANSLTALMYFITGVLTLIVLYVSEKYYMEHFNLNGFAFCFPVLVASLCLNIMLQAENMALLCLVMSLFVVAQYFLLSANREYEDLYRIGKNYLKIALILTVLFGISVLVFLPDDASYFKTAEFLTLSSKVCYIAVIGSVLLLIFFLLGLAPLHFGLTDYVSVEVLPVYSYLNLVPMLPLWFVLVKLNEKVFFSFDVQFRRIYLLFGVLSVLFSGIGANATRLIKKTFSYLRLYFSGVALIMLSALNADSATLSFIYIEISVLILLGLNIGLYAFRSNGEYLNNLGMLTGLGRSKPHASFIFVFFLLAAVCLLPFSGVFVFIQSLNLAVYSKCLIFVVLVGLLMLLPAHLRFVRTIYFEPKTQFYDRTDGGIYFVWIFVLLLLLLCFFSPEVLNWQRYLMEAFL